MTWALLIVSLSGGLFSQAASMQSIPMMSREACSAAAKSFAESSSGPIGFLCVSSETGEILRFSKK
jgi:hypothetical protein